MKRCFAALVALSAVVWAAGPTKAGDHAPRYGSRGIQFGFYHYPPPGYAAPGSPAPGYAPSYAPMMAPSGCHGSAPRGYSPSYSPGYSYAPTYSPSYSPSFSPGYSPGASFSPSYSPGGCTGSGYSPSYSFGYSPGASYGPGYGPQMGIFPFGPGSILEAIGMFKRVREALDELKPPADTATTTDLKEIKDRLRALENRDTAGELGKRLDKIDTALQRLNNVELPQIKDRLTELEKKKK